MQVQNINYKMQYSLHSLSCDQSLPLILTPYPDADLICRIPDFFFWELGNLFLFFVGFSFFAFLKFFDFVVACYTMKSKKKGKTVYVR